MFGFFSLSLLGKFLCIISLHKTGSMGNECTNELSFYRKRMVFEILLKAVWNIYKKRYANFALKRLFVTSIICCEDTHIL